MQIGIFYQNNENWIGGTYYIQNLIHSLVLQPANKQPFITIFGDKKTDFEQLQKLTAYPKLRFWQLDTPLKYTFLERMVNKIWRGLGRGNWYEHRPRLDAVFPIALEHRYLVALASKQIYWIPDFQEAYLPQLNTPEELKKIQNNKAFIAENAQYLVLSSEAAKADFERFYAKIARCQLQVLPFAVTLPEAYKSLNIKELWQKYELAPKYFFAPNQFWKHKNQAAIIDAIRLLREKYPDILLAFSGKEYDHRHPDYAEGLKQRVLAEGLSANIRFLGFIDRAEQLALMQAAQAIVQPSLFEGWSTVVEDAKALGKFLVLSDLPVHREQLAAPYSPAHVAFFDPHRPQAIADCLEEVWINPPNPPQVDYKAQIQAFGQTLMDFLAKK